ncbi:hypothetical protein [Alteriqipengyuania lutimaris]|uniref:hypothetical protein n=1 Tax=Alteriqipengyuania lutimaris TaxID=1538146 RepID=UPI001CFD6D96|nr:hypothetical protein [Alteriqipengyuania lutimaris]
MKSLSLIALSLSFSAATATVPLSAQVYEPCYPAYLDNMASCIPGQSYYSECMRTADSLYRQCLRTGIAIYM